MNTTIADAALFVFGGLAVLGGCVVCVGIASTLCRLFRRKTIDPGHWETALDDDDVMVRIRWSIPDSRGRYLWVRHYPATAWGRAAVWRQVAEWNAEGKTPAEFRGWWVA